MFGLSARQIFILLVVVGLMYAGAQYVPAYFAAFQLNDYIRQEVKYAATSKKTLDALRGEIVQKAGDLDISIAPKDVQITRRGPAFTLELNYRWPINMRIYHHVLVFHTSQMGEMFENASN